MSGLSPTRAFSDAKNTPEIGAISPRPAHAAPPNSASEFGPEFASNSAQPKKGAP